MTPWRGRGENKVVKRRGEHRGGGEVRTRWRRRGEKPVTETCNVARPAGMLACHWQQLQAGCIRKVRHQHTM